MKNDRREFIRNTMLMGLAAAAGGCASRGGWAGIGGGSGAPMHGFAAKPMKRVRVGFIGVGSRGTAAVHRVAQIPGCEVTAICDISAEALDRNLTWLAEHGYRAPKEFGRGGDADAWKGLCDSDCCDVVYSATPRALHCAINVYALDHGKHVLQEVPGAFTIEECWATVEAAERNRLHCMMLENCAYGEAEMLAYNLAMLGKFGEIVECEVGYTHDQRDLQYNPKDGKFWRMERHRTHHGNYYPTHGLVPAGRCLGINRGDRFDQLVSMETKSASFERFGRDNFPAGDWRHDARMVKGDVNLCLLHTNMGKVVSLKHNVCTPCPYDRGNVLHGTMGTFCGIYFPESADKAYAMGSACRFGWLEKSADPLEVFFPLEKAEKLRKEHMHPFWKAYGDVSRKIGGHGGKDFIMDLRWAYCLQNGLPLDTDVYDLATYSSIVELSERSVLAGHTTLDYPDYTRGGWRTAKPSPVEPMDPKTFGTIVGVEDKDALKVKGS